MKRLWTLLVVAFTAVALAIPATAGADTREVVVIPDACNGQAYDATNDMHRLVPTDLDPAEYSYNTTTDVLTVWLKAGYIYFEDRDAYAGGANQFDSGWKGDAVYWGNSKDNVACAGDGKDTMFGRGGNDYLAGENGDDTISGGVGDDVLKGGDGKDLLRGQGDNDTIWGGRGEDTVHGQPGDDVIYGFAPDGTQAVADDVPDRKLTGGNGNDTIFAGDAAAPATDPTAQVLVKGNTGADTITGGDYHDMLLGNGNDDTIDGGKGNDFIDGMNGADTLKGGAGTDQIMGGDGADWADGGANSDWIQGQDDNDTLYGGDEDPGTGLADQSDEILGFWVGGFNDVVWGGNNNDTIYGSDGRMFFSDASPATGILQIAHQPALGGPLGGDSFIIGFDRYTYVGALTPPAAATGTLRFNAAGALWGAAAQAAYNGSTLTIGTVTYTFVLVDTPAPNEIILPTVGGTWAQLRASVLASTFGNPDAGLLCGATGVNTTWNCAVTAKTPGAAGNFLTLQATTNPLALNVFAAFAGGANTVPGQILIGFGEPTVAQNVAETQANTRAALSGGAGAATATSIPVGAVYVPFPGGPASPVTVGTWSSNRLPLTTVAVGDAANYPLYDSSADPAIPPYPNTIPVIWGINQTAPFGNLFLTNSMTGGSDAGGGGPVTGVAAPFGDWLTGDFGHDTVYGADGADTIDGGPDNDTLYGGNGNDIIGGAGGADTLYGDGGNDILNALLDDDARDVLHGGAGNDVFNGFVCDAAFPDSANELPGGGNDVSNEFILNSSEIETIVNC